MDSLMGSKLAEVISKLINGNKLSICQAVEKINSYLIEFQTNEPQKRKLINHLFENTHSILSKNCCISLLSMLTENCKASVIDLSYLISSLLSLINSKVENSIYCLYALTDLMVCFQDHFIEKYSIRNPSHPFIEILRNSNDKRDNLHYLIYQQIQIIYENEKVTTEAATQMLKPVFVYIFLEQSSYKHLIAQYLIKILNKNEQLNDLISVYFSFLKDEDLADKDVIESLRHLINNVTNQTEKIESKFQIHKIIGLLIKIDLKHSFNCSSDWIKLKRWIASLSDKNDDLKVLITDKLLSILAANMSRISTVNLKHYLEFVDICIENYNGESNVCLALFIPNILEYVITFSALEYDDKFKIIKFQVLKSLKTIEKRIYETSSKNIFDVSKTQIFSIMSYEDKEQVLKDPNETCNRDNLNLLCAYFVLNDTDLELTKNITALFKKLSIRLPYLSVLFFSLYINKIKMSTNQTIVYHLVTTFIDLIVPKMDVNLFLNVFNYLIDSSNEENLMVKLICLKQLTRLCAMKYDYLIYPRLSKELVTLDYKYSANKNRIKILYTKAFCIYQLILYRPDYYAQELLATISSLINNCSHQEDAGVCAVLIDTMAFLCHSEVVDIESTFNALYPQFKNEKRLLVLNAYCRLISEVVSREELYSPDNPDNFYEKMMKQLWSMCKLNDPNALNTDTSNSALIGLSHFKRSYFKCSFLPESIQEKLKVKNKSLLSKEQNLSKTLDEVFEIIPASCFFDLFYSLDPNSFEGLNKLLQKFLTEEIDSIPRRILSSAQEKELSIDDQQRIQKSFYKLIDDYLTKEFNSCLNEQNKNTKIDGTYLVYCYNSPIELNSYGKPVKRQIPINWKNYENNFTLLITRCKFYFNEKLLKDLTNGLDRFIYKAYESCINALEFNLKLEENNKTVEEDKTHLIVIARNKLLQILIDGFNETSKKNVELLIDDINLFILVLGSIIESISGFILIHSKNDENIIQDHSKWLEMIIDFILNINENKISTKNEFHAFSYSSVFKVNELDFIYEIFKKSSSMNKYFLSKVQPVCLKFKIKPYLNQYLERIQLEFFDIETEDKMSLESFGRYLQNFIKTKKQFSENENQHVNSLLNKMCQKFENLLSDKKKQDLLQEYLRILTECLNCLYDEESVFYDEKSLLEKLIKSLYKSFIQKEFPFKNSLYLPFTYNFVNLNCIAYKSNLITNENLIKIYECLSKESKLNALVAFFCRFLLFFGYSEAHDWLNIHYVKWMKQITDFKLNISKDINELEYSIEGLLTAITGVLDGCLHFKQMNYFTDETDKLLKPEQTLKEIIKLFKSTENEADLKELKTKLKMVLSLMYLNHTELKYEALYSMPNNYDYLDEASILRATCTELSQIAKISSPTQLNEKQFEFFVSLLFNSCKHSQTLTLPPLNWYYFISSLLKCKFGKIVETNLIRLVISQLKTSNSAYTLMKNFLIDTNYFSCLQFESQIFILSSLNVIWSRLDKILLLKFLNKIKIFLKQNCKEDSQMFSSILDSLEEFSKTHKEDLDNYSEILDFYYFIYSEFSFDIRDSYQRKIADKLANTLISFDDERLMNYLNALEKIPIMNQKLLMVFYIKCRLVSLQYKSISFISNSISYVILLVDNADELSRRIFINIFTECMIVNRNKAYADLQKSLQKSNNLINGAFNWLIEFMETVKLLNSTNSLTSIQIEFVLSLFTCFVYSWCNQWTTENETDLQIIDYYLETDEMNSNINFYLRKLCKLSFWKQIQLKLIEWLLTVCNFKFISPKSQDNLRNALIELFLIQENLNPDVWFKYADLFQNK